MNKKNRNLLIAIFIILTLTAFLYFEWPYLSGRVNMLKNGVEKNQSHLVLGNSERLRLLIERQGKYI